MVRRSLNWRVLIGTFIFVTVAAGGLVSLHAWQLSKTAAAMLAHAQAVQATNPRRAAEYFDRYLRLVPSDNSARVKLAESYGKFAATAPEQFKQRAVVLYYRALATRPDPAVQSALRLELAELLLDSELGRFAEAETVAQEVLNSEAQNARAQRLVALAKFYQFETGAYATADPKELQLVQTLDQARLQNPDEIKLAIAMATLYRERGNFVRREIPELTETECRQRADGCLDTLVQHSPENPRVYLTRSAYRRQYQLAGAEEDLDQALRLAPDNVEVLQVAGNLALAEGLAAGRNPATKEQSQAALTRAREYFQRLFAKTDYQPGVDSFLGLGDALLGLGETDQALSQWRTALQKFESPEALTTIHARIADTLLGAERTAEAKQSLEAIDRSLTDLGPAVAAEQRRLIVLRQGLRWGAWHLQQEGQLSDAISRLRQVVADKQRTAVDLEIASRAWLLLGEAYSRLGEWQEAAGAYDQAGILQPTLAAAHASAANAWLMAGRPEQAADRAEQAVAIQPAAPFWFLLATSQYRYQLSLPVRDRTWIRLEQALQVLRREGASTGLPSPWLVDFLHAELSVTKAQANNDVQAGVTEAAKALQSVETRHSASVDCLSQLCRMYQRFGLQADADRAASQLRSLSDGAVEGDLCAAQLAIARSDFDRASQVLDGLGRSLPAETARRVRSIRLALALAKQDLVAAHSVLMEELASNPSDLLTIRRLAELDLERQDLKALQSRVDLLAKLGAAGQPLAHYYRSVAYLLGGTAKQPDLPSARAEQEQLAALRPEWPETFTLRGMIEQNSGNVNQAVAAYERAIQLGETRIGPFEQLISLLERQRRYADVERYLSKLEAQMPLSQRLTELASAQHLRNDRQQEALTSARSSVSRRPSDPQAHVLLGRMLLVCNQVAEAESEFVRALELAPTDERGWSALLSYYARTGAADKAKETLTKLATQATFADTERNFVLGQGYEYLGETDEAARFYELASAEMPDNVSLQLRLANFYLRQDPSRVEGFLKRALELDPKSADARQMLAAFWGSRGTENDLQRAEELLAESIGGTLPGIEDRRLNALLLARFGGAEKADRAIEMLESIVASSDGQPGDTITLAQLYELQANWATDKTVADAKLQAAQRLLVTVAARPDPNLGHVATLITFLLRHEQAAEAGLWLDTYEQTLSRQTRFDADAVAGYIELRIQHGSAAGRCAKWIEALDQKDTNLVRPVSLRAQALAVTEKSEQIRPLVEAQATRILGSVPDEPARVRVHGALGDLYMAVQDYASAEKWYRQFVAATPDRYDLVVDCVARQGRLSEAIDLCEAAAKTDESARPAQVLAAALVANSAQPADLARAEPILSAALRQFPEDANLHYFAAMFHTIQDQSDLAIRSFRKVVELRPRHTTALNNLAFLLGEQPSGRDEALRFIDRALAIAGTDPGLLDTKGTILVYQGKAAEAIELLKLATEGSTADPRYNFHLAAAYRAAGDLPNARQQLNLALERKLESQLLTQNDRQLLKDLRTTLIPEASGVPSGRR